MWALVSLLLLVMGLFKENFMFFVFSAIFAALDVLYDWRHSYRAIRHEFCFLAPEKGTQNDTPKNPPEKFSDFGNREA